MKQLFFTGFLQVFFVSLNTVFLAKGMVVGILLAAFTISFIWTLNVRKTVAATLPERITYSLGAAIGSVSGYYLAILLI